MSLRRSTNRSGGDTRIKLSKPLPSAPQGFTGLKAHKLASLDGERPVARKAVELWPATTDQAGFTRASRQQV